MIVNKAIIANQVDTCVDSVKLFANHLNAYLLRSSLSLSFFLSLSLSLSLSHQILLRKFKFWNEKNKLAFVAKHLVSTSDEADVFFSDHLTSNMWMKLVTWPKIRTTLRLAGLVYFLVWKHVISIHI